MDCPSCTGPHAVGARFCMACGRPLQPADEVVRTRRTVTVVFGDLAGSTMLGERLDPEALREVMLRYYTLMRDCLERHGGTVEKFIGDAVMAVFGVPRVHEDDVLRGVRAAWDMQRALAELNGELGAALGVRLQLRVGVNTGEVLYSREFGDGHALVSGDTVNVAARLEQHAPDGGILLGAVSHQVVAPYVTAEPVEPLQVKGKSQPLPVWRLLAVDPDPNGAGRPLLRSADLIGRQTELQQLELAWQRSLAQRSCHLFTLLGDPGVGKSRLAGEFAAALREHGAVLGQLRCQPYGGAGVPQALAELLRQLLAPLRPAAGEGADQAASAFAATLRELLADPDGAAAAGLLESVLNGTAAATEDTFWALGRLLEALGAQRPVCLLFDDLQWAQPTLLDLIDHLADWTSGAPLLLLCLARADLLDQRPHWGSGKLSATSLVLGPLSGADCEELVAACAEVTLHDAAAGQSATVRRVAAIAEGNPLFAEQLVAVLTDGGSVDELPPSIQALLAARLDRLPAVERQVLEGASVIGREFSVPGLRALELPATQGLFASALQSLVRRRLLESAGRRPDGLAEYRFVHLLVREVCGAGLPKRQRAVLHQRYAGWLAQAEPVRHELVGRHLAEAYRHRQELGPLGAAVDQEAAQLKAAAARHLLTAGQQALGRGECAWAVELLTQAVELADGESGERAPAQLRLAEALIATGAGERARGLLSDLLVGQALAGSGGPAPAPVAPLPSAASVASAAGTGGPGVTPDPCLLAHARLQLAYLELPDTGMSQLLSTASQLLPVFTAAADDLGQARARLAVAHGRQARGRYVEAAREFEAALRCAHRSGAVLEQATALGGLAVTLWLGPEPAGAAVARCRELLAAHAGGRPAVRAALCCPLAVLLAMGGQHDEARALVAEAGRIAEELGVAAPQAAIQTFAGLVETLAAAPRAAEERFRQARELSSRSGDAATFETATSALAALLLDQARVAEASALLVDQHGPTDSPLQLAERNTLHARLLARQGEFTRARELAAEAVRAAAATDSPVGQAHALLGRAEVLLTAGDHAQARAVAARAARAFAEKGHQVGAARALALGDGVGPR
ncbi:adenylate/guanylate cyclase domain-containing protein [Kitasatospora azatica]|uniref:adenylate/guanylate cyclase domain-containing protein n=1 Tax=Kitasatospora azatica TaxID=58347 RepID=UPI00055DAF1B|nr:adenylate/guanylate cyclase domain-containing protein [Kitasatospora azatica]